MKAKDIIDNQAIIVECARTFRKEANSIMRELANDFNFSLESGELFPKNIYSHKYNNKGNFRGKWTYYFHGAECRFDNLETGQIIELIYITKPEFGYLDGYFFYNYMRTTKTFFELSHWFKNDGNVWTALEVLADDGFLTRDPHVTIGRNVIAL